MICRPVVTILTAGILQLWYINFQWFTDLLSLSWLSMIYRFAVTILTVIDLQTSCNYVEWHRSTDLMSLSWLSLIYRPLLTMSNDINQQICCPCLDCHWFTDLLALCWLSLIYTLVVTMLTVIDLQTCFIPDTSLISGCHYDDCWSMIYRPVITMLTVIYLHIWSHYVDCHWSTELL